MIQMLIFYFLRVLRVFLQKVFLQALRVDKKFNQFIRGLVPKKVPVFSTRVLTRYERDRVLISASVVAFVLV